MNKQETLKSLELTELQVELLIKSVECYQSSKSQGALLNGLMGLMLTGKDDDGGTKKIDKAKNDLEENMKKANEETEQLKKDTTILLGKLYNLK